MTAAKTRYQAVEAAAQAYASLETFAAVERLLEQGAYGAHAQRTVEKIRRLCQAERMFQLQLFDALSERRLAFPDEKPL